MSTNYPETKQNKNTKLLFGLIVMYKWGDLLSTFIRSDGQVRNSTVLTETPDSVHTSSKLFLHTCMTVNPIYVRLLSVVILGVCEWCGASAPLTAAPLTLNIHQHTSHTNQSCHSYNPQDVSFLSVVSVFITHLWFSSIFCSSVTVMLRSSWGWKLLNIWSLERAFVWWEGCIALM